MTGVLSLSGWVRSTTSTSPLARAETRPATASDMRASSWRACSVGAEGLFQPVRADGGIDLRAAKRRPAAPREPVLDGGQLVGASHRQRLGAGAAGDAGDVG